MENLSLFIGIIVGLITIAGGIIAFFEYVRKGPSKRELIIRSVIIIVIVLLVVGGGIFISSTTTISVHTPTNPLNNSLANSSTPSPTLPNTPTATPTLSPSPSVLSNNPNNPKLPLTLECVSGCLGYMEIKLRSITNDTTTGNIVWAFFIKNKSGTNCPDVYFGNPYLKTPDGTRNQPTNQLSDWPMSTNQTVEEDAYFTSFNSGVRYTLYFEISYVCGNMSSYASENYKLYDFYFQ